VTEVDRDAPPPSGDGDAKVVVEIDPWGITIEVRPGETVFDAAYRQGWHWPTNCYGQARCTVCHMTVLEGAAAASPPDHAETAMLDRLQRLVYRKAGDLTLRLACRTRPHNDMRVEMRRAPRHDEHRETAT
jgi:2Fe-2S ferredoxin